MHKRLGEYLVDTYPNGGWMVQDDGDGPYIKEWTLAEPRPTDAAVTAWAVGEATRTRCAAIQRELDAIDLQSVRPVRAKLAGTATPEDEAKIADLEAQAQTLRTELADMQKG